MTCSFSAATLLRLLTTVIVIAMSLGPIRAVTEASVKASCGESCGICGDCEDGVCVRRVRIDGVNPRANELRRLVTAARTSIQFTPNVYQEGCENLAYEWSFGDGGTSSAATPTHSYANTGNYEVKLTVRCDGSCDKKEATVKVVIAAVDLDIDKVAEGDEESRGDYVIRLADNNGAPRRKVTLRRAEPADFDGKLILRQPNFKLKVFDAPEGGNEVTFNGFDNEFSNLSIPAEGLEFWVEGYRQSERMRDTGLSLKVRHSPEVQDQVAFTVLWVDKPAVKFYGAVSENNSSKTDYQLWNASSTLALGPQVFDGIFSPVVRMGWGLETRASVHPRDFVFSGSGLRLERDAAVRDYIHNDPNPFTSSDFSAVIPPGNDTEDANTINRLQDRDPRPDGFIYVVDAPGLPIHVPAASGLIMRTRNNFKAFASVLFDGKLIRCSEVREYFVRFSVIQTDAPSGKNWIVLRPADIENDLQAAHGTTKLTVDLK